MAQHFIAIDWDQNQLHVVSASVSGGSVRFHQAVRIDTDGSPNLAEAASLGQMLRDKLKSLGIGGAPVLACLSRERVILKEVRYPVVPDHEEPNVVRFQAIKELNDNPDDVYIDYTPLPALATDGERRAQVMVARKELVNAYRTLCEAAGLRLAAIAPRAYGMASCLHRLLGTSVLVPSPDPVGAPIALVTVGEKWAEFCILKGESLLQARTLSLGAGLAGEIRRNLAVYSGQHAGDPVKAVYLALSGEQAALREKLVESLDIPVHPFDPFAGAEGKELPGAGRGTFVGAIGLLHLMAHKKQLPVNFARVKEGRAPTDPNQRMYVLVAALLLVLLGGGFVVGQKVLEGKREQLRDKEEESRDLKTQLSKKRDERLLMQALHDWDSVNWPDELYELASRMPRVDRTFRVQSLEGISEKPPARTGVQLTLQQQKEKPPPRLEDLGTRPAARLHLKFVAPSETPLNALNGELINAPSDKGSRFYRPKPHTVNRGSYDKDIEIFKRPPDQYSRKIFVK